MSEPLLTVKNLCVNYRGCHEGAAAVAGVSFSLQAGSVLGVIGESGAGKSTMALALMGLLGAEDAEVSGTVELAGRELLSLSEKELCAVRGKDVGMIFQDPVGSLDPALRIDDQVAEAVRIHGDMGRAEALGRAHDQLAAVGIGPELLAAAPYAHQLSGGLCQRAMIAAALAARPRLLIADEPTSSLDMTLQAQIIALLNARQRQDGPAMLFISHDLALVSKIADDIMVMYQGSAVEMGSRATVLSSPAHPYTRELLSAWAGQGLGEPGTPVANDAGCGEAGAPEAPEGGAVVVSA